MSKFVHKLGQRRCSELLPMIFKALLPVVIVNAIGVRECGACAGVVWFVGRPEEGHRGASAPRLSVLSVFLYRRLSVYLSFSLSLFA